MNDVQKLRDMLQKIQQGKGYFFNRNQEQVKFLLQGLLTNKKRYGYMSCPCRLASGKRDDDKDIVCPCLYRKPDVEEFGSCYCGLYVSSAWNEGITAPVHVPERRPPAGKR